MTRNYNKETSVMNKALKIVLCVILGVLAVFVFGWVTMSLWNWLIPSLFNGPVLTFWQALGLLLLSKIIFGFGGKGGNGKWRYRGGYWKQHYYNKWSSMTPEEREQLKAKMREKWCYKEPGRAPENSPSTNV
jgi:hypothetical protein